jgi:hypothetical protein
LFDIEPTSRDIHANIHDFSIAFPWASIATRQTQPQYPHGVESIVWALHTLNDRPIGQANSYGFGSLEIALY